MTLFATIVLQVQHGPNPAMQQRLSKSLAEIGFERSIMGAKGPVLLPQTMYACECETKHVGYKATSLERQRLADLVSTCLDELGFEGNFFISVSSQCSWGFRPAPRKAQKSAVDSDYQGVLDRSPSPA